MIRVSWRRLRWISVFLLIGAGVFVYWFDLLPLPEVEDGDYSMQSVSAQAECSRLGLGGLSLGQPVWWSAAADQNVVWVAGDTKWKTVPDAKVKRYPKLTSSRPLYGSVVFGTFRSEGGEPTRFGCVVDESAGTGTGYDRLYFDANGDLDLTNDPVLTPAESRKGAMGQETTFHPLTVSFDFGPKFGKRPVQMLPWLVEFDAIEKGEVRLQIFASEARKGKIQIGRHRFNALLCQLSAVTGRFDKPGTALHLTPTGLFRNGPSLSWWGGAQLSCFRLVDGKFYTVAATPTGDTLLVRRYRGEMGTLRIDPGKRDISDAQISGWLASKTTAVPVGEEPQGYDRFQPVRACELPVGDYCASELTFRYGRLSFWISQNYHTDGKWHGAVPERDWLYSFKIRKGKPFVLDFSNRPEVMFVSPAKDQTFKAGDEVEVEAVLTDPVLGIMFRGLDDTSRKEKRKNGDGVVEVNLSLTPTVKISDSAGKTLAEGKMPFG